MSDENSKFKIEPIKSDPETKAFLKKKEELVIRMLSGYLIPNAKQVNHG